MAAYWRRFTVLLSFVYLLSSCFSGVGIGASTTSEELLHKFGNVNATRTKEKIYIDMVTQNSCIRLLNATHQIGCSSGQEGNTGVVHYMQTEDDYTFVLTDGGTPPYMPVLESINFTAKNVRRLLAHSGRVNGIVVISMNLTSDHQPKGFSADKACPNDAYGKYYSKSHENYTCFEWNPSGHGLLFDDLGVPIFSLTNQTDVETILDKCWDHYNKPVDGKAKTYPLCAVQLVASMAAAKDAQTCIRRSNLITNLNPSIYCDPLGDKNVVATIKAVPNSYKRDNKTVIIVATRMDSLSMFYNEYPSADTTVTGIVTLLATAKALWKLQDAINAHNHSKDVMFTFFQGEAFDYIGSSRMLYEMQKGQFPVKYSDDDGKVHLSKIQFEHISQFVELSQVGMRQDENSLWLHVDPDVRSKTSVDSLLSNLTNFGRQSNTSFRDAGQGHPLPPASVQRFLKEPEGPSLPSFVITDHRAAFTNKYYNSRLDLPPQIEAEYPSDLNGTEEYNFNTTQSKRIADLATALARYLFWAATENEPDAEQSEKLQADREGVDHLLYCFLKSPHCELFNFSVSPDNADALNKNKQPFPFYVSISSSTNQVTSLLQHVLARFTGSEVDRDKDHCKLQDGDHDQRYTYLWMQGNMTTPGGKRNPVCYKSTVLLSKSESPAFDIDGYDWNSGLYSTWTESRWETIKVRVFLIPSKQLQVLTLTVGIGFLLISLVAVYFINSSADVLFQNATPDQST